MSGCFLAGDVYLSIPYKQACFIFRISIMQRIILDQTLTNTWNEIPLYTLLSPLESGS